MLMWLFCVKLCLLLYDNSSCQLSRQTLRKTSSAKEPMRTRGIARMWKAEKHSDRLLAVSWLSVFYCYFTVLYLHPT